MELSTKSNTGYVQAEQIKGVDDTKETISGFLAKIDTAKMEGHDWVETSEDVIKYYNRGPKGLNGAEFFIYQGIKVCLPGQSERIEANMHIPIAERMHGKGEGKTNV